MASKAAGTKSSLSFFVTTYCPLLANQGVYQIDDDLLELYKTS